MEIVVDEHPQFPKEQKIFALLENNTDLTSADFSMQFQIYNSKWKRRPENNHKSRQQDQSRTPRCALSFHGFSHSVSKRSD